MKKSWEVLLFTLLGLCITSCTLFPATATPFVSIATSTRLHFGTATPSATPTQLPTLQPVTATIPYVVIGTFTASPTPTTVTVTIDNTSKGDYLNIFRTTDSLRYRVGPLEHGGYAIGPNDNFLVYCTNSGYLYAAKFGDKYLTPIGDVKKFFAVHKEMAPDYQFVIFINNNNYMVEVRENSFGQNQVFVIPRNLTR